MSHSQSPFHCFVLRSNKRRLGSWESGNVSPHFRLPPHPPQDHIQKVLLSLALKIEAAHRPFQKRRLFLAYSFFVSLVCKELGEGLEGTQAFVLRDIVHTVVRVLAVPEEKEREGVVRELFAPCCDTLLAVCKAAMESCPQVGGSFMS